MSASDERIFSNWLAPKRRVTNLGVKAAAAGPRQSRSCLASAGGTRITAPEDGRGFSAVDQELLDILACPRDQTALQLQDNQLTCANGHIFPVINGVPVLLLAEKEQTIGVASASLNASQAGTGGPVYVDTLGLSDEEKRGIERDWTADSKIDPVISYLVGATSGWGYVKLIGKLGRYPIPDIPVPSSNGERLLDIGSNWGRWSVSAARKGWRVIGLDPSLGALMAARRAFSSSAPKIHFVCGDARFLPFRADAFKCVFSYSVIQHFSEGDAELAIMQMGRVLHADGFAKVQLAHAGGLRSTYHRTRRDYHDQGIFRVRYWSLAAMRDVFEKSIGPTDLAAEAFGGLGLLNEDWNYVSVKAKILIVLSLIMRKMSLWLKPLIKLADSVYVHSRKR